MGHPAVWKNVLCDDQYVHAETYENKGSQMWCVEASSCLALCQEDDILTEVLYWGAVTHRLVSRGNGERQRETAQRSCSSGSRPRRQDLIHTSVP